MKSIGLLASFIWYCLTHGEERFWQALRNWSGAHEIIWMEKGVQHDTFYWSRRAPWDMPDDY